MEMTYFDTLLYTKYNPERRNGKKRVTVLTYEGLEFLSGWIGRLNFFQRKTADFAINKPSVSKLKKKYIHKQSQQTNKIMIVFENPSGSGGISFAFAYELCAYCS
jgi:hypothetical protein